MAHSNTRSGLGYAASDATTYTAVALSLPRFAGSPPAVAAGALKTVLALMRQAMEVWVAFVGVGANIANNAGAVGRVGQLLEVCEELRVVQGLDSGDVASRRQVLEGRGGVLYLMISKKTYCIKPISPS